ncbi:hypothetical protein [Microvirga massiliensis]|uniref:hypothetical protein n=1 Tax=Microvirga massiliensis TaxID=1033741 RepID=UPI00062B7F05|nr:hypothetical protein [Microvirga massiliensis]
MPLRLNGGIAQAAEVERVVPGAQDTKAADHRIEFTLQVTDPASPPRFSYASRFTGASRQASGSA